MRYVPTLKYYRIVKDCPVLELYKDKVFFIERSVNKPRLFIPKDHNGVSTSVFKHYLNLSEVNLLKRLGYIK